MGCEVMGLLLALACCVCAVAIESCGSNDLAQYKVRFEGLWTKAIFPKVYPVLRPKAEWSPIVGRSHSSGYKLFSVGSLVTSGLQAFVEYGDSSKLAEEGQGHSQILDAFTSQPLHYGHGVTESQFFSDSSRHQVSFVVKIVPSPDWFVGVDSYSLCQNKKWIDSAEFDLFPMDAGSQQGYTFSSPRWRSDPQEVIHEITSTYPNRSADAFYYPSLKSLPPIAKVTFTRIHSYRVDNTAAAAVVSSLPGPHKQDSVLDHSGAAMIKPPVLLMARNLTLEYRNTPPLFTPTTPQPTTKTTRPKSSLREHTTPREDTTAHQHTTVPTSVTLSQKILAILDGIMQGKVTTTPPPTVATATQPTTGWFGWFTTPPTPKVLYVTQASSMQDDEDTLYPQTEGSGMVEETRNVQVMAETAAPAELGYQSNMILPPDDDSMFEEKSCLVSSWTEWTACSRTCGYGMKIRTREVTKWTGNVACPELKMEQLCGSMKKCDWNHFSLRFNSTKSIFGNQKRIRQKKIKSDTSGVNVTKGALTGNSGSFRRRYKMRQQS